MLAGGLKLFKALVRGHGLWLKKALCIAREAAQRHNALLYIHMQTYIKLFHIACSPQIVRFSDKKGYDLWMKIEVQF